jgi:hypothetical protein
MDVKVYPFRKGIGYGNIIWDERSKGDAYYRTSQYAGHNGTFPANHPIAPKSGVFQRELGSQCGDSQALREFRGRGYWASCFPEGDGVTWQPLNGQSDEQCLKDIQESFPQLSAAWAVAEGAF